MTLKKKVVIAASVIALILDVVMFRVKQYQLSDFLEIDIYIILVLFPAVFLIIPVAVSFFISSIIKGQYKAATFQRLLLWFFIPSFLVALWGLYVFDQKANYKYRAVNAQHNARYFPFYGDARDANISLAISSLQKTLSDEGDYRLKRLRVVEWDTLQGGKAATCYDIQLIYCLGRICTDENTYASRQLVVNGKVKNIFTKASIQEAHGAIQYQVIEGIVSKMAAQQDFDSVSAMAGNLIMDVVKIRE